MSSRAEISNMFHEFKISINFHTTSIFIIFNTSSIAFEINFIIMIHFT